MDPRFAEEFGQEEITEFHKRLLEKCKSMVDMSRRHMSSYYEQWDRNLEVYEGKRVVDKEDVAAQNRNEPQKMVVPMTYAQVQTFKAFCTAMYMQKERMFSLVGTGEEDHKAAKVAEALIARDLTVNKFILKLDQFLLDLARFGVGVLKTTWVKETMWSTVPVEQPPPMLFGSPMMQEPTVTMERQQVTKYLGNRVLNVSPYCFFPDTRLPLSRMQDGEFCASEDVYNMTDLYQWSAEGVVVGAEHVKPYKADTNNERQRRSHLTRLLERSSGTAHDVVSPSKNTSGTTVITEVQMKVVPKQFTYPDDAGKEVYPFGEDMTPQKWVVWYANDDRIVNIEELSFDHDSFTYDVAEFQPDVHNLVNIALADVIDKLQDVNSWLINAHVTNVRKVIGDKLIVDPSKVMMDDLVQRRPVIRLSKNAAGTGVKDAVMQLGMVDVTSNHMQDSQLLHQTMQTTTGINDNAMGQFFTGRRTAQEARLAGSGSAARLKQTATLVFVMSLESMARKMVSNHKQGLDEATYVQVVGDLADPLVYQQFKLVSREDLGGSYDFEVFEGTLPSDRSTQAQAIQEFLVALLSNPETMLMLGYDPKKLTEEWLELRGIRNPKRFELDQVRMQGLMQMMQAAQQNAMPNANEPGRNGSGVPGRSATVPGRGPVNVGLVGEDEE